MEIADVSIGTTAPELSGFQAFADPASGAVKALDCSMAFDSDSVRLVVVGRGPLGAFTARMSGVHMKGKALAGDCECRSSTPPSSMEWSMAEAWCGLHTNASHLHALYHL